MAQGSVGGGSQNNWKEDGIIYVTPPKGDLPFKKEEGNGGRNESAFWVADTPVKWNSDEPKPKATTANVNGTDMLVTLRNPDKQIDESNIKEYHPLITFFNEVLATLIGDGYKNDIINLKNRPNAITVWNYLEQKYLIPSKTVNLKK